MLPSARMQTVPMALAERTLKPSTSEHDNRRIEIAIDSFHISAFSSGVYIFVVDIDCGAIFWPTFMAV